MVVGGPGVKPQLSITGRRLGRPAGRLRLEGRPGSGEPDFWASGIIFPTAGCWEVTGRAGDAVLSFVVQVIDATGDSPRPASPARRDARLAQPAQSAL